MASYLSRLPKEILANILIHLPLPQLLSLNQYHDKYLWYAKSVADFKLLIDLKSSTATWYEFYWTLRTQSDYPNWSKPADLDWFQFYRKLLNGHEINIICNGRELGKTKIIDDNFMYSVNHIINVVNNKRYGIAFIDKLSRPVIFIHKPSLDRNIISAEIIDKVVIINKGRAHKFTFKLSSNMLGKLKMEIRDSLLGYTGRRTLYGYRKS